MNPPTGHSTLRGTAISPEGDPRLRPPGVALWPWTGLRSALRRRPLALDCLVAAALGALALWDTHLVANLGGPQWLQIAAILAICASLTVRRRIPVVMVLVIAVAGGTQTLVSPEFRHGSFTEFVAILFVAYSLAAHAGSRARIAGPALLGALATTIVIRDPSSKWSGDLIEELALLGAAWAIGAVARRRHERTVAAESSAEMIRSRQEALTREALAHERSRISRELHDLVAHSVGVMVVQAGAGRVALETNSSQSRAAFLAIEDTGRHALAEMRRLVGLLRDDDRLSSSTPQPGLGDLGALVDHVRISGPAVNLDVRGSRRTVPAGVDLAAFRVVQEALTNVLKHANASSVDVTIDYCDDALTLHIVDNGRGARAAALPHDGHGLIGMRERVLLYGGELRAEPCPGRGFEVLARLPLEEPNR